MKYKNDKTSPHWLLKLLLSQWLHGKENMCRDKYSVSASGNLNNLSLSMFIFSRV